ncbi:hypothetical protein [Streptomyces apocyni]|uniref:hypothetical protein n=1 Tax=Streptomyces apocyni TaxID=2654677 RepID=UPI0012EA777E|nr:hypothetical protein [Streptomyces apocyni]
MTNMPDTDTTPGTHAHTRTTGDDLDAAPQPNSRALTLWAGWGLGLFLPMVLGSWLIALATPEAAQCLTQGGCPPPPSAVFWVPFWSALALGFTALCWNRQGPQRLRAGVIAAQWGAQLTLTMVIVTVGASSLH